MVTNPRKKSGKGAARVPSKTPGPAKRPKIEGTREALIAAAKKLFAEKGYDATSVKDLSNEAGVNISLVSYHFGGKENLYQACLQEFAESKLAAAERILKPPSSCEEFKVRIRMFVEELIRSCEAEPEVTKIIDRDIHLSKAITERIFRETFLFVYETSVEFFRTSQKLGIMQPRFDPLIAASLLFGTVMHLNRMEGLSQKIYGRSLRDATHRAAAIDHIQTIFVNSLLIPSADRQRGEA
ncbi:MAG TPA: TetR family transcriptional regulator [Bdellovibrionota bacterium]|nr:TetR family transcriptional regulator [Bdellovibrionota bacterium]